MSKTLVVNVISGQIAVTDSGTSAATYNMGADTGVAITAAPGATVTDTFNISDYGIISLTGANIHATINIAAGTALTPDTLSARETMTDGTLTVNGGPNTDYYVGGAVQFFTGTQVFLNTGLEGKGEVVVGSSGKAAGRLEINGPLLDQYVEIGLNGTAKAPAGVVLDQPATYNSQIDFMAGSTDYVSLKGIIATSWDLKADFLTMFNGTKVVESLYVANTTPLYVEQSKWGVSVTNSMSNAVQNALPGGKETLLPLHT